MALHIAASLWIHLACFLGSSSFGVDLMYKTIKSTPNDEEPKKHAPPLTRARRYRIASLRSHDTRLGFVPHHNLAALETAPTVPPIKIAPKAKS